MYFFFFYLSVRIGRVVVRSFIAKRKPPVVCDALFLRSDHHHHHYPRHITKFACLIFYVNEFFRGKMLIWFHAYKWVSKQQIRTKTCLGSSSLCTRNAPRHQKSYNQLKKFASQFQFPTLGHRGNYIIPSYALTESNSNDNICCACTYLIYKTPHLRMKRSGVTTFLCLFTPTHLIP